MMVRLYAFPLNCVIVMLTTLFAKYALVLSFQICYFLSAFHCLLCCICPLAVKGNSILMSTVLLYIQGGPRKVKPTTNLLVTFECIGKIQ